ncbi:DNA-binding GntR family transcriptional regulator [Streptomyces sp. TLI_235]|nr:GntR family transcriptional regulator [Streptomyces sp. TLI_235]PBC71253.1 DNA-binding GntR family transcriptional regulator [Streptomyces sp. TLI_235]
MPGQQTERRSPAYLDIARDLGEDIGRGRFPVGQNLPSERRLATVYGVNRQTVRAALQHLRTQGLVAGDHLGTYVLSPREGRAARPPAGPAPTHGFPGSFLRPARPAAGIGRLLRRPPEHWAATALELPPERAALAYDHRLKDEDGRTLQSASSWFAPVLTILLPGLGRSAWALGEDAEAGREADLAELYGWAATAGLRLRAADRVQLARDAAEDDPPGGLEVRRTIADQHGRTLIGTVFRIADEQAELRYADSQALLPGDTRPRTPGAARRIAEPDRAVLHSWASPNAPDRGLALRARIVLACEHASAEEAAGRLGHSAQLVAAWRDRFRAGGLQALEASPRRGRPRSR